MPDSIPASKAIVTTRKDCPLCASKSRPYVDTTIAELRDCIVAPTDSGTVIDEVSDTSNGHNSNGNGNPPAGGINYLRIEQSVRELLGKLNDSTEFTYADLLLHANEHTLVTHLEGVRIKAEGNYLIVGEQVYQRVDPKDSLALGISFGLGELLSGRMKLSAPAWVNMQALLWRMMGNQGTDDFLTAMLEKTQSGEVDSSSPIGSEFLKRQSKLAQNKIPRTETEPDVTANESNSAEDTDGTTG